MTLADQIKALPEWPAPLEVSGDWVPLVNQYRCELDAALARLALAREVIYERVQVRSEDDKAAIRALLAALNPLEPPR